MGINDDSNLTADLQIGATTLGMVRLYVQGEGIDLPMDFTPEEAEEIAAEILAAVELARSGGPKPSAKPPRSDKAGAGKRPQSRNTGHSAGHSAGRSAGRSGADSRGRPKDPRRPGGRGKPRH